MTFTEQVARAGAKEPSPETLDELKGLLERAKDIVVEDRFRTSATLEAYGQIKAIQIHLDRHHRITTQKTNP